MSPKVNAVLCGEYAALNSHLRVVELCQQAIFFPCERGVYDAQGRADGLPQIQRNSVTGNRGGIHEIKGGVSHGIDLNTVLLAREGRLRNIDTGTTCQVREECASSSARNRRAFQDVKHCSSQELHIETWLFTGNDGTVGDIEHRAGHCADQDAGITGIADTGIIEGDLRAMAGIFNKKTRAPPVSEESLSVTLLSDSKVF